MYLWGEKERKKDEKVKEEEVRREKSIPWKFIINFSAPGSPIQ